MMVCFASRLLAGVVLGASALPGPPSEALLADDACGAGSGSEGSCAVNALQRSSRDVGHASPNGDSDSASQGGMHPPLNEPAIKLEDGAPLKSWIFPNAVQVVTFNDPVLDNITTMAASTMNFFDFCGRWLNYFWPKVSFLTQELRRRVKALPDEKDVTPEHHSKLKTFTLAVTWLMCTNDVEVRQGKPMAAPVSRYFKALASLPSSSLEVPLFDKDLPVPADTLSASSDCLLYMGSLACDLGYLADSLMGSKTSGDGSCWSALQVPPFPYSPRLTAMLKLTDGGQEHLMNHTEYLACQEKPMTQELVREYCPMHGHVAAGAFGVADWGKAPPEGSESYNDIQQCNSRVGQLPVNFPDCSSPDSCTLEDFGLLKP